MQQVGFSHGRRRVLAAMGGLGLLGASGCCALRPYPAEGLVGNGPVSDATRILAPGPLQHSPLKPRFAIDVHAHFFNASDVNVAGFLEYAVAHTMQEPLRGFVKMMGPVLDDLAGFATSAADEYNQLLRMTKTISLLDASAYGSALDTTIAARRDHIAERLFESMKKHGVDARYIELRQQYIRVLNFQGTAPAAFSAAMVREALEPKNRPQTLSPAIRAQVLSGSTLDPNGVIQFVGYMLQDRWMNLRTYMRSYSVDVGAFGVNAAFGSLVDFDYWLDCPAHSSRQDQMKVQSFISLLSDGYMLPLVSYNPWTDIKRDGESLQLVKDAITRYGFIGVKIYPPMGFYPYGNEDNQVPGTALLRPDLHELDGRLEAVFDWCISESVPVMAHTEESLGRDDASDEFGGPIGWTALLRKYTAKGTAPLINLGHFGGDTPKTDANGVSTNNRWPAAFSALMKQNAGQRMYGDFGYWTAFRACELNDRDSCDKVMNRIDQAKEAFPGLGARLMYGTDWLMLSKETDWPGYAQYVAAALKGSIDQDNLFYKNAIECFGLGRNGGQRRRIVQRFGVNNLPAWLASA